VDIYLVGGVLEKERIVWRLFDFFICVYFRGMGQSWWFAMYDVL
jgi:hypothetical protein